MQLTYGEIGAPQGKARKGFLLRDKQVPAAKTNGLSFILSWTQVFLPVTEKLFPAFHRLKYQQTHQKTSV